MDLGEKGRLMDFMTTQDLEELSKESTDYYVSIVMPASPIAYSGLQNPVLLRDLTYQIEQKISESLLERRKVEKYLKPIVDLSYDDHFWQDQFSSLLIYLSNTGLRTFKLPLDLEQKITVSHFAYLIPAFEYINNNQGYFILILDKGGCRLFQADRYQISELTPKHLVEDEKTYLRNLEVEEEQFYHVGKEGDRSGTHEGVMFHGHGNTKDDNKIRAKQYMQFIDSEVNKILKNMTQPLILAGAGVGFLPDIYRSLNSYHNLFDKGLKINTWPLDIKALHQKSWKQMEKLIDAKIHDAKESYCNKKDTAQISNELEEIMLGAKYGKLDTLFLNLEKETFGYFEENNHITIRNTANENDESLTNLAAIYAFQNNGIVIPLSLAQMPDKTSLAAIFRY